MSPKNTFNQAPDNLAALVEYFILAYEKEILSETSRGVATYIALVSKDLANFDWDEKKFIENIQGESLTPKALNQEASDDNYYPQLDPNNKRNERLNKFLAFHYTQALNPSQAGSLLYSRPKYPRLIDSAIAHLSVSNWNVHNAILILEKINNRLNYEGDLTIVWREDAKAYVPSGFHSHIPDL